MRPHPKPSSVLLAVAVLLAGCEPAGPGARVYFPGCTELSGYESSIAELENALRVGLAASLSEQAHDNWTLECVVENHGERAVTRLRLFLAPDEHPVWSSTFGLELPQREAAVAALRSVVERLRTTRDKNTGQRPRRRGLGWIA